MTENTPRRPVASVVIGTAGHIDHGKSSLIEKLTGTHPSRLKEEQERGMTIDIGYAELPVSDDVTAGIIDVPGHEKFIRNMVAGASGVDFVLLVIAADDGVMPQTREHLQIMRLLGIERGMTIITKIDAVDQELIELVREEVTEYLQGTFLADAPMLAVSNVTGEGIDEVRRELLRCLSEIPERDTSGVFRMPIQRAFSVKGHGTVVTGVPVSGRVEPGEELELLPKGARVRVRGLQVHHAAATEACVGHRAALNITDVNYRDVHRGDVVAARGYFGSATLLEARLHYLDHFDVPLRNDVPVRLHVGTSDIGGRLVLLDKKVMLPGESGLVQIRLEEPVVVTAGDRYIVRLASPVVTLGGGVVLGETRWHLKRFRDWLNENIEQKEAHLGDRVGYLEYVIRSQGKKLINTGALALQMKCGPDELRGDLDALREGGTVRFVAREKAWIHRDMFEQAAKDVGAALLKSHKADRLTAGFATSHVAKAAKLELPLTESVLAELVQRKRLELLPGHLFRHRDYTGGLSKEDMRLVERIEAMHEEELFGAPIRAEIVAELGKPEKKVKDLMTYLLQMRKLVAITPDLALHRKAVEKAERILVERLRQGPMPSKEFKDLVGATRKYVIPLLEYFDKKGLTQRNGNERTLVEGWEERAFQTTLEAPAE